MHVVALVDSRNASRDELESALRGAGLEVSAFADWRQARTALSAITVDAVVLTDWRRSGGRGAYRYLRGPSRNAPFVLVRDVPLDQQDPRFAATVAYSEGVPSLGETVTAVCEAAVPLLRLGKWTVDARRRMLCLGGQCVDLTPIETDILRVLIEEQGGFVTSSDLVARAWGISTLLDRRVLYTHVAWLRRKLHDGLDAADPIISERQRGYRFDPGPP